MAIDINAFNRFVDLAQNAQVGDNARITLQKSGSGQIEGVRTTETSVFSRLMERTFRGAEAKAAYADVRNEVVEVLKNLFGVKNVDHLPKAVRDAFVEGEILCDRPLTQRRLKAVLTAASQTLGYGSLAELKKSVNMNVDLQEKMGGLSADGDPVAVPIEEDDDDRIYLDDDDLDEANNELADQFKAAVAELAEEKGANGVYTAEELKTFAKGVYGQQSDIGFFRDAGVAARVKDEIEGLKNTPETPLLAKLYGSRAEAERVMANVDSIRAFLDGFDEMVAPDSLLEDLGLALDRAKAVLNGQSVSVANGKPELTKEEAAGFLRGLKVPVPGDQQSVVAMIKSFGNSMLGVESRYSKMQSDATAQVKTYMDNLIGTASGDYKANLKAVKARMLEILPKLDPLGKDLGNISLGRPGFMESLKYLVDMERQTNMKVHDSRLGNRTLEVINGDWNFGLRNSSELEPDHLVRVKVDDHGEGFDLNLD